MTMNCRELLHFFSLRTCNRAQWEIRQLADEMLEICRKRCPAIFANAGPGCVRGHCPEKRPCGHTRASVGKENNDG
jgi:thymidylate synthase (FAD)